jgi:hypothetical protein
VRDAIKQLLPELFLQLGDLHAQRRLHDIQPLGRACDGAIFEQRDEVLDLSEVHAKWVDSVSANLYNGAERISFFAAAGLGKPGRYLRKTLICDVL